MKSPAVLVCFALKEEARAFQRTAADKPGVSILITGIGKKNARMAVDAAFLFHPPGIVLTCGFAGALDQSLVTGDVLFSAENRELREQLLEAGAKPAKFVCASKVATTAVEKLELRRTRNADAVEMESGVIQDMCRERGIPCATVRAISDTANEDLPLDFNSLTNADLSLNHLKLMLAVAKSPGKIPALLRLRKNCKFAAERLAVVLRKVIESNLPSPER